MSTLYDLANSPLHKNQIFDKKITGSKFLIGPSSQGRHIFLCSDLPCASDGAKLNMHWVMRVGPMSYQAYFP